MAVTKKVLVAGEGGVGRTTALFRYTENFFSSATKMTLGFQFFSKTVEVEGETFNLSFFDLAGQERWRFLFDSIALGANGAILFFDLTRPMTLEKIVQWVDILRRCDPNLPILFVGTKTDLIENIMIDDEYAMCLKERFNLFDYIKISSKTGENVELIFENLIRKMAGLELLPTPIIDVSPHQVQIRRRNESKRRNRNLTKTYKINDFITLELENNKTHIYVKGKDFIQCKYLLLNIPVDKITEYDNINSIDEASEILDKSLEYKSIVEFKISPKTEFWGHCSNIQAWAENGYDTRVLHRNLAFPLLRKLTEVGDPHAKRAFKEEIALRFENGNLTVQNYLIEEGYLSFLDKEELRSLLDGVPNKEQIINKSSLKKNKALSIF